MKQATSHRAISPPVVVRKRRPFGLDAPRVLDPFRLETEIRTWLATRLPSGLVLRLASEATPRPCERPALLVLLPGCRVVLLDIGSGTPDRSRSLTLLADCKARGIVPVLVGSIDDLRAAFRGLGIEPEDH